MADKISPRSAPGSPWRRGSPRRTPRRRAPCRPPHRCWDRVADGDQSELRQARHQVGGNRCPLAQQQQRFDVLETLGHAVDIRNCIGPDRDRVSAISQTMEAFAPHRHSRREFRFSFWLRGLRLARAGKRHYRLKYASAIVFRVSAAPRYGSAGRGHLTARGAPHVPQH